MTEDYNAKTTDELLRLGRSTAALRKAARANRAVLSLRSCYAAGWQSAIP
jgi:hypothetical protein